MERDAYREMIAVEDRHWWFAGRRRIAAHVLARAGLPREARILDAGCGSGGNLSLLARFGAVEAFEYDADARAHANGRGITEVKAGSLPEGIPPELRGYDLITLFDVLEHIERDAEALASLKTRLKPGGKLLITVPALPSMWSKHDALHHHFRRYTKTGLKELLTQGGWNVHYLSYFNTLLFPLAWVMRKCGTSGGANLPPALINTLLEEVFALERLFMPHISYPIGVSLIALAEKPL